MADLSDVQAALQSVVSATLYPTAPTTPAQESVCGVPVQILLGWPSPQALAAAMKTGVSVLSIYPRQTERDTTRYSFDYEEFNVPAATYTIAVTGQVVTIGGAAPDPFFPQNLYILIGNVPFLYTAQGGQTAAQAAAGLSALVAAAFPGTAVSGATITLPGAYLILAARVGVTGTAERELGRQDREFQLTIWSPTSDDRNTVAAYVDPRLRAQTFIALPDGSAGRLVYRGSPFTDFDMKAGVYRRDLIYTVEYGTTDAITAEQVVATQVEAGLTPDGTPAPTVTITS